MTVDRGGARAERPAPERESGRTTLVGTNKVAFSGSQMQRIIKDQSMEAEWCIEGIPADSEESRSTEARRHLREKGVVSESNSRGILEESGKTSKRRAREQ